jgi:hypothetical protein
LTGGGLTRRGFIAGAAAGGASLALGRAAGAVVPSARAASRATATAVAAPISLPTPAQVRADFQRMVDFGPRLTGSANHNAYIAWLEQELTAAGVQLSTCDSYEINRWLVEDFGLSVLDGDLVKGSVLLVDLPLPLPLTTALFVALSTYPSIVGVPAGEGDGTENIILNTHTDGEGFAEENGGVCLVHLARHFGSLPAGQRLKRSLVFSLFTGHMEPELPETQGFIDDNPELIAQAAAAITIEHFGCSEWIDSSGAGYHATGQAETLGVWTTQGRLFDITRDALIDHNLPRTALLRPPVQFGVGAAFQSAGVPQIGAIAGPTYLLTVSENSDMDKLDETLAAQQIAWVADIITRLDPVPAAELRMGDPTLGGSKPSPPGTGGMDFERGVACLAPVAAVPGPGPGPVGSSSPPVRAGRLIVHDGGPGRHLDGLPVQLHTTSGTFAHLELELRRGTRVLARARVARVSTRMTRVLLVPGRGRRFAPGRYTLTIGDAGGTLITRHVLLHG